MESGFGHLRGVSGGCASDRLSCNAQDLSRTPAFLTNVDPGEGLSRYKVLAQGCHGFNLNRG